MRVFKNLKTRTIYARLKNGAILMFTGNEWKQVADYPQTGNFEMPREMCPSVYERLERES